MKFDPPLPPLKLRHLWRWLHRWMGLLAGLAFVLLGLTGSLLAFRDEIDALLAPEFHRTSAQGARKSFEELVALAIGAIQLSGRTPMNCFSFSNLC